MPDGPHPPGHPPQPLTLITLGSPALRAGGVPNATSGAHATGPANGPTVTLFDLGKPLALITYIACSPERAVPREHLIDLLWGDVEPEAAKHALRQTLWYIRKRLGDRPLIAGGDTLSIVGSLDCDRDRFLAAVADGDTESVVRLYSGEFFPEFAAPGGVEFERWADIERQRLRAFFWRSAESLVRRWMSAGRLRDAQTLARRVRDTDPLREGGWRVLFETLIASGDSISGALEADAFDRLAEAEGIEPEPATRSLLRVVRQHPASSREAPAAEPRSLFAELVGREQEFAQLLAAWEAARGGKTTHVHVLAPAGLGKTRLLTDANARLRATRVRTLFIRASLGARDIPFGLAGDLAEALAQLPGASGISTGSARTLVALNPALSALYPAALPDAAGDPADVIRRRTVAVRELVAAVADEQPIAIFIDDMQWADVRSRQLIMGIVGALERSRVLVVTASRPTVDALAPAEGSLTIRLAPLGAAAVGALLASIAALPSAMWAEQLPGELCDATGGSPLLVLETIQLAMEAGLLVRGDTWSAPHTGRLFATLGAGGALRQRVERLDRVERWVMTLLAVAGVPLSRDAVTVAAARSPDEIVTALGSLERRGLAARHGEHWSPSHDEIAAMAVELALPDARRAAARSLGKMILDGHPTGTRSLRQAGALFAEADDQGLLGTAFVRFARIARDAGDRQTNRALAQDFLGERATPEGVARLVRALPPLHRAGLYSARRQLAAVGASAAIPLLFLLNAFIVRDPPPDVVLAIGSVGADSVARVYRVPVRAAQLGSSSVVDVGIGRPRWQFRADPTMGTLRRHPTHASWMLDRVMPDSGGIELFEIGDDGSDRRVTYAVGDDQSPSWSPDGQLLAFYTARWDSASHYDIAILDTRTNDVRALTTGADASDGSPFWSPDGSRIAFSRHYWDGRPDAACVIDVDGGGLRCIGASPAGTSILGGWYDVHHVMVELKGEPRRLGRLDVETDAIDTLLILRREDAATVSEDGRWVMCQCRRVGHAPNSVLLVPVDDPNRVLELNVARIGAGGRLLAFESTARSRGYADRVSIDPGLGAPMVGVPHRLTAAGLTPNGDTIALGSVRWASLDTTVATIDSTGLMVPKRTGAVEITASAGGWRSATRKVVTLPRDTATVLRDDWSAEIGPAWRPFGYPRPRIERAPEGFAALLNNGDGSFMSGVYSTRRYATSRGLALDTWISNPINAEHWQIISVYLHDAFTDAGLAGWDHSTGNMPVRTYTWPACGVMYPASEGVRFGDTLDIVINRMGERGTVLVPKSFKAGAWFHVRLQLFPDGRCGVALNGVAVGISPVPTMHDSAVRVVTFGNSVGTKVLVGPVWVRAGVPDDIDWSRVGIRVPNAPPRGWSPAR